MTKAEYLSLAESKYSELAKLEEQKNFYEYEKRFDEIWQELGREVLQSNISVLSKDRRKKKDLKSIRKDRDF